MSLKITEYGAFESPKISGLERTEGAPAGNFVKKEKPVRPAPSVKEKPAPEKISVTSAVSNRVKNPIGAKLIVIISFLVVIALGGVTYLVSHYITKDIRINAEENNLTLNARTASEVEGRITAVISSVEMFTDMINSNSGNETELTRIENMFFDRNKSIIAVHYPQSCRTFVNAPFFISHEREQELASRYFAAEADVIESARGGSFQIENASAFLNVPAVAFGYQIVSEKDDAVFVLFSLDDLSEGFASGGVNQSFFVNKDGIVIVHSDLQYMMNAADESSNPVFQAMRESTRNNRQITYTNEAGEEYIGAFRKLGIAPETGIITVVQTSVVLEGIDATTRRNMYITGVFLALAILIIYFFAKSLSTPLKQLTAIVNDINSGNFNTERFADLNLTRRDEIGVLARSTRQERDILNTFTKLTNKGVTQAIIRKEIDFEPHLKDVTIFFSDIRGFTAISDGFKNRFGDESAAEIINFLNDYMSRMVSCITKTGGTVDKFEGDAIMAAWGVLRNESLDWENLPDSPEKDRLREAHDEYVEQDALSAITCCVAMRWSLMKYNKDALEFTKKHEGEPKAQYKPHIKIGAGLNTGRVTVGFMGSYDKMEFTSIGDAVNFASRTEASNKPCGTDILITQDTYDILKKKYIRCPENNYRIPQECEAQEIIVEEIPVDFEVKGKGKQHFFGVVNMPRFNIDEFFGDDPLYESDEECARFVGERGPVNLKQLRRLLGIEEPDFGKVNLNEEENKVQLASS